MAGHRISPTLPQYQMEIKDQAFKLKYQRSPQIIYLQQSPLT
jgi:hypothetical protein